MMLSQTFPRRPVRHWAFLLLTLLVAFALRLHQLGGQSLWWDEGISLHLATSTLPDLLADRVNNIHPPLYFILLKGWVSLVGTTPFAARYSSTCAAFLQVALVYAIARRWFRTPLPITRPHPTDYRSPITDYLSLLFITLSPLSVIYGQEIRVYAFLPLVTLNLWALTWLMVDGRTIPPRRLLFFGLIAWLGLHLHYISAVVLLYCGLWLLLALVRQRRWADLRRFLLMVLLVALAALPWFTAVLQNRVTVQAEASAGTYLSDPVPFDYLLNQVWSFHFTGLAGAVGEATVRQLASLVGGLLLVLVVWRTVDRATRQRTLRLTLQWLLPLTAALLVWSVRSFSHPRYIAFAGVGVLLLAAWLAGSSALRRSNQSRLSHWIQSGLALLLVLAVTAISLFALHRYFTHPDAAKDDVRGAAQFLAQEADANDLILIPDTDWSLPFEYAGAAPVLMPGVTDPAAMWAALAQATAVSRRVFVLDYERGTRDFQDVVPYLLEQHGALTAVHPFGDVLMREYQLETAVTPPIFTPTQLQFGPLTLTGYAIEPDAAANTAVAIALQWQLAEPTANRLQAKLSLVGVDGFLAGETGGLLLDSYGAPTDFWDMGSAITTYHVLPLTPGTAPLPHELVLSLFHSTPDGFQTETVRDVTGVLQGQQLVLDDLALLPAAGTLDPNEGESNPYDMAYPVPRNPRPLFGIGLEGAALSQTELIPGQPLFVYLLWRAPDQPVTLGLQPVVRLMQGEGVLAEADSQLLPVFPTTQWQPGQLVAEQRRLVVPPDASGAAEVVVMLNGRTLPIGTVQISTETRQFTPPSPQVPLDVSFGEVARLVGFDLPQTAVSLNEPIPLTLYWQSVQTGVPTAYTVFAQLLAEDGHLVGQHDAMPGNGRRPTTGWLEGEFILDEHLLQWHEPYTGTAVIVVGLYDPLTGERLLLPDGRDFLQLPLSVTVLP